MQKRSSAWRRLRLLLAGSMAAGVAVAMFSAAPALAYSNNNNTSPPYNECPAVGKTPTAANCCS